MSQAARPPNASSPRPSPPSDGGEGVNPPSNSASMSKTIEEILAPKPEARPRIYAYSIDDKAHAGLLKVGQTTRDVKQRVA